METLMLFLNLAAYFVVGFYSVAWTCWWVAEFGGLDPRPPKAVAILVPVAAWAWLIAGWMS